LRGASLLREYNIPEPVTGGLLFAAAFWLVFLLSGYRVTFELFLAALSAALGGSPRPPRPPGNIDP